MHKIKSLDHPLVKQVLFHPRPDFEPEPQGNISYFEIKDKQGLKIAGEWHSCKKEGAGLLLFFHGNGEIASDYRDIGPFFNSLNWDFLVVDYKGYGNSEGEADSENLKEDVLFIFDYLKKKRPEIPIAVMGRSLGSAAALYLALKRGEEIRALILESAFADTKPLLDLLGLDKSFLGDLQEENCFPNIKAIQSYQGPCLIIHGKRDSLIPFSQAEKLKKNSQSADLSMLGIEMADHNSLLYYGLRDYFAAIKKILNKGN